MIASSSFVMVSVDAFGGSGSSSSGGVSSSWIQQGPKGLSDGTIVKLASIRYNCNDGIPMRDKVVVITGAAGGIGKRLCEVVYGLGGTIVAMDRDVKGLKQLQTELLDNNNNDDNNKNNGDDNSKNHHRIQTLPTNHEDLNSVLSAARIIQKEYPHIDLLINNAGIAYSSYNQVSLSKHGQDLAFTVNYLSHFLLTEELLPLLLKNGGGRIVQVTSSFHWKVDGSELTPIPTSTTTTSDDDDDDKHETVPMAYQGNIKRQSPYHASRSYANTKLAQIWHTRSLHEELASSKHFSSLDSCSVVCVCPTWVGTGILAEEYRDFFNKMAFSVNGPGVTSILNAMFRTDEELQKAIQYHPPNNKNNKNKQENEKEPPFYFVANSKTIQYVPFLYTHPFVTCYFLSKMKWRDSIIDLLGLVLLIGQQFTYCGSSLLLQKTSPESYNKVSERRAFHQWSKAEVQKIISSE